jgi:hypothetical protein
MLEHRLIVRQWLRLDQAHTSWEGWPDPSDLDRRVTLRHRYLNLARGSRDQRLMFVTVHLRLDLIWTAQI